MTLDKYAHLWTAIETQGSRDPAAITASYSNQGVDIGVSRVRTQCGQSQVGKANGSGGIPENSEVTSYLPCSLSSRISSQKHKGVTWNDLKISRPTERDQRIKKRDFLWLFKQRGLMF